MAKMGDELVADARSTARTFLRKTRPQRWLHAQGVASRAAELARTVRKSDRPVLITAAWLHDIGYGQEIQVTGFHPLDGATYLLANGWDQLIAALVAHHSGARFNVAGTVRITDGRVRFRGRRALRPKSVGCGTVGHEVMPSDVGKWGCLRLHSHIRRASS